MSFASFVLRPSIQLLLLQHLFSFLCPGVPSRLRFFSHPPAPGLCRMQTDGVSGVEVLLAFGAAVSPPLRSVWSSICSARFSQSFRVLAMSFRRYTTKNYILQQTFWTQENQSTTRRVCLPTSPSFLPIGSH